MYRGEDPSRVALFREQDRGRGAKGKKRHLSRCLLGCRADDVFTEQQWHARHVRSVCCAVPRALEMLFTADWCRPPELGPRSIGPALWVRPWGRGGAACASRSSRAVCVRDRLHPCGCLLMLSYRKPIINAVSAEIPGPALSLGLPALPAHGHREKGTPPVPAKGANSRQGPAGPSSGLEGGHLLEVRRAEGFREAPQAETPDPSQAAPT